MRLDSFLLVDLEVEVLRAVLLDLAMGCWGCGPRSMVVVEEEEMVESFFCSQKRKGVEIGVYT